MTFTSDGVGVNPASVITNGGGQAITTITTGTVAGDGRVTYATSAIKANSR